MNSCLSLCLEGEWAVSDRSVYIKLFKHVRRIIVHIHALRVRAFPPLRWSVVLLLGCGKTRTVMIIGFAGE